MKWWVIAVAVGLPVLGVLARRAYRDIDGPAKQRFENEVKPRLKRLGMVALYATMVLWAVVWFTAPDHYRNALSETLRGLIEGTPVPAEDGKTAP